MLYCFLFLIICCDLQVHRSVQILRDKQELAETQKELAKLQLAHKESSSSSHSQSSEEKTSATAADPKKTDNTSDAHNQLALALPHQVAPQQQPVAPPPQAPPQNLTQQQSYYLPPAQLPNPPAQTHQTQHTHSQYPTSDSQYRTPQLQDISRVAPQPTQSQVNQTPPVQQFPQYQQQWPQQLPQQPQQPSMQLPQQPQQPSMQLPQQPQQPSMQPQIRPPSTTVYSSYPPSQPTNPSPPEMLPSSMPMQVPFPGMPQPVSSRVDAMPYGYSGAGRTVPQQQQPPQQIKGTFGPQPGDGYAAAGTQPALPPGSAYMMYDSEGRSHHPPQPPHYTQGGYPPTTVSHQNPQPTTGPNLMVRNPSHSQFFRNHPYSELIEKLVSMGFRGDHVASVIQRMEESGQPVDFNSVLDRLNVHSSGGSQRGWSG